MEEGHFGAAIWTPPIRRWTTGRRAFSAPEIWEPFPNFYFIFRVMKKNNKAGNSLNVVEREPVSTRFLNPKASESSYKPKQRSYRKNESKKISSGTRKSRHSNVRRRNVQRRNGSAAKRTRPWIYDTQIEIDILVLKRIFCMHFR